MAKKKAGAKKVEPKTPTRRLPKVVRLEFSEKDHERLEGLAEAKGLSMAAFSRMAVLDRMREVEEELKR